MIISKIYANLHSFVDSLFLKTLTLTQIVTKNAEINQTQGDVFKSIEFIMLNRLEESTIYPVSKNFQLCVTNSQ